MRIVGLLRGINVGKSVKAPMKELKNLLEEIGLTDVLTYLNSGNVVFSSTVPLPELQQSIQLSLERRFGEHIPILLLEGSRVIAIRDAIPVEWGSSEAEQTYVAYLFPEVDKPSLIDELPIKRDLLQIKYVPSAFIWNIKRENFNRSQITKISSHESYSKMTTRNVTTARKLAELCES